MASTESHLTGSSSRSPYDGDRRSSDEIRRDIERQRDELDVSTEELQHKLAPRELAEQLWNDVRTRVGGSAGDVVEVVKRHPLPIGLIGAGIAWWIYETSSGRGPSFAKRGYDPDHDSIGVGSTSTGSYRSNSAYGSSSSYASGASGYGTAEEENENWRQRSMRIAQRSTERLRTGATSARQGFNDAVDRNPLALGAACFSLGILAGIAVPSSKWEDRTLGDASEKVSRKAKDVAANAAVKAAEKGASVVQDAADRIREEAERPSSQYRGTGSSSGSTGAGWTGTG
jgi:uncharacterized protein DUF3618